MAAVSFPVRPSRTYKPKGPLNSFTRSGYQRTKTNPRGLHWAVDLPCPVDEIIQLPLKAKLIDKGWGGDTGWWMEWQFLEGAWKGRYGRFFHMSRKNGDPVGKIRSRKSACGRSGNTGNSSGPHVHFELGKYRWDKARDPRWDPQPTFKDAVAGGDY